ncbi:protein rolling stone-like [Mizuhopecten yessoensis]|uniref:Protein rolling stone n=1 Tax=Mizuhopecten yessoensis TaxID=6573 RepID=A0A210QFC5_MIZYE|nr:protein rolling stone-like [Mizuhopecten yessoensis]XP_021359474.1 protein rolling stone-like [Mizuhopecten yessoensis]XP_021359475.1 protein rolling stone-like [Mizuhopecten yessoensis]OWF47446.1 Protein rolling stone [Mizuhopecten yessoensis]
MGLSRHHPCNKHNFFLTHGDGRDFVTLQGGHLYPYLAWASFWSLYHLAWIIVEIYWAATDNQNDAEFFIYLTNLGYVLLVSFTWLDLAAVIYYIVKVKNDGDVTSMPLLWKVNWVLYNMAMTTAIVVVLLYWILLATSFGPGSINKHLINGVIALLYISFTAKPSRILHFYQPVMFAALYSIFSVIYFGAGGGNVYSVLDWSKPGNALALTLPLVLVGVPLIHLAVCGIYRARVEIWRKCCSPDGSQTFPRTDSEMGMGSTVKNADKISTICNETKRTDTV